MEGDGGSARVSHRVGWSRVPPALHHRCTSAAAQHRVRVLPADLAIRSAHKQRLCAQQAGRPLCHGQATKPCPILCVQSGAANPSCSPLPVEPRENSAICRSVMMPPPGAAAPPAAAAAAESRAARAARFTSAISSASSVSSAQMAVRPSEVGRMPAGADTAGSASMPGGREQGGCGG